MRAIKPLVLASLLTLVPLSGFAQESVDGEPDVTIRQEGERTVEEYRVNGFLYAVKVIPKNGKPFEGFRWRTDDKLKLNFLWVLVYITKAPPGKVSTMWFDDIVVAYPTTHRAALQELAARSEGVTLGKLGRVRMEAEGIELFGKHGRNVRRRTRLVLVGFARGEAPVESGKKSHNFIPW